MTLPPLYEWQAKELAEHGSDPKRAMFVSPRLGKTRCAAECMKLWAVDRYLVVCPLIVAPVWEALLTEMGFATVNCYSGSLPTRLSHLDVLRDASPGVATVCIANYDFLKGAVDDLISCRFQAVIGDESHLLKSPSAKRARAFRRLAWRASFVRLLTGTPTPNHFGDLWGQMAALDKDEWGTSYERYAQRYLIRSAMFPSRVLGHRNTEELQRRLLRYASFVRREEAFGPDSWQVVTRHLQLPPRAAGLYRKLVKDWTLAEEGVEAAHILKRLIRLQQLTSGFLPTDDGNRIDVHQTKSDAVAADLAEIIESGEKAVIFHRFRWEGERYHALLADMPGVRSYRLSGDTPIAERARILREFEKGSGSHVAVVQTQAGGVGVSFATATHALFVSRGFSFTDDEQARDRVYAPGKPRCVTYYECDNTVDGYIAGILGSKRNIHDSVTHADIKELAYGKIGR